MKQVVLIFTLSALVFSCNRSSCGDKIRNGSEQGVDCGGDCIECQDMYIGWANNPNFKKLKGLWYFNYASNVTAGQNEEGIAASQIVIELDSAKAKLELTNKFVSYPESEHYEMYGTVGVPLYPGRYSFIANKNEVIINGTKVKSVSDSMLVMEQVSSGNQVSNYTLSKHKIDYHAETSYTWELEIMNNLTESNKLRVVSYLNSQEIANPKVLSNGTKFYTGNVTFNPGNFTSDGYLQIVFEKIYGYSFNVDQEIEYRFVLKNSQGKKVISSGIRKQCLKNCTFQAQGLTVIYNK